MSYKIWTHKTSSDANFTESRLENAAKLIDVKVLSRKPLGALWPEDVIINVIDDKPPCDTFKCGPLLIVNHDVRKSLEQFSDDIEYLPVQVQLKNKSYTEYYFANILASENILDRGNSIYEEFDDEIENISSLRLIENKTTSKVFFLDVDDYILIVRDEVATTIAQKKLSGVKFYSPENWNP